MFNENFGVFHVAINLDIFFIQMIIFFLHYLVELCLFLSSKNIVVQGEQLYFITNFTYKCALYYQWFKSSCHRNILFLCFSRWQKLAFCQIATHFHNGFQVYILVAFLFHFFLTCILDSQVLLFFFLCTEILGLLRYGNTWKETSDMKTKSRFHYHTCIYKLNNVQRHANFSDKSLTVMMRSISRSQFELITEFSGLCLFLRRPSM